MANKYNIFITGGNRGIGRGLLELLCQEHNVIFSVRSESKGEETLKSLNGCNAKYVVMNVDDADSVNTAAEEIKKIVNTVYILFNNAGILIPEYNIHAIDTSEESILTTFNTNTLGVLRVCKAIVPLMLNGGRIINISSGMGQLDDMESGSTAYRLSKTALNALTKILSNELSMMNISVNTICPGWVQTDMGGSSATLTVKESTKKIVEFSLRDNFPNGKFLRHGEIIPW